MAYEFESATILLPVIDEIQFLERTVEMIQKDCDADVREYLFLVSEKTCPESLKICQRLHQAQPDRFLIYPQKLPFLGGALREGFEQARGSHIVLMATDMETDPAKVKDLIAEAKQTPKQIIVCSRWIEDGGFEGYSFLKWLLNWIFQKMFAGLYGVKLTDLTYAFRIYPTSLLKNIKWEELRHPFLFECLVKPLNLGIPVREIPCVWRARTEGKSQNSFFRNFRYLRIGLRAKFYPQEKITKQERG